MLIERDNQILRFSLFALGNRIPVHVPEHKFPHPLHGLLHLRRHPDIVPVAAVCHNIVNKKVQTLAAAIADHAADLLWHIRFLHYTGSHRIVHIMMDIGNLVSQSYNLSFQCGRHSYGLMV